MKEIIDLCKKYNVKIIEDNAESIEVTIKIRFWEVWEMFQP